ncbi:MAG: hypothetical protein ASARMPREDX12_000960 [Alectoria sarmentosa]|nr:MAG: hypothetical protein ASARMPREDX12_000960 [Alectoria sarmentosa]
MLRYLSSRPEMRKPMMWVGNIILVASSVGAAFATNPVQLVMTQGVLNGIGSGLLFAPSMSLVDEWFAERRSLAYGIYFGACSLAGAILPPIFSVILSRFGSKPMMIGWAIFSGLAISLSLLRIRSRLQTSTTAGGVSISYKFVDKPLFWLLVVSTVLQALSQYLPAVYLPSYAVDFGAKVENGALLLTYFNFASVICQPSLGFLADKYGVALPLLLSTVISSFAVLVIWGLSRHYWSVTLVAILFGGFSGGFVVLRNRFATAIVGDSDHPSQELIVSGVLMLLRGIATLGSGFLGAKLVQETESMGLGSGSYAGKNSSLIDAMFSAYTGCESGFKTANN